VQQPADLVSLFVAPLNRIGARYMVTGAVAAIVYGEPRLTRDIDIVIALARRDIASIVAAFPPADFYVPPSEAIATEIERPAHGHFNIIHRTSALKADFYPAGQDPLHFWAMDQRVPIKVSGQRVQIAPAEYVIIRKLEYFRAGGSDRHLRDIRAMLRIAPEHIDTSFISAQAERLGLQTEWDAVTSHE
jgi:hypothetical protein